MAEVWFTFFPSSVPTWPNCTTPRSDSLSANTLCHKVRTYFVFLARIIEYPLNNLNKRIEIGHTFWKTNTITLQAEYLWLITWKICSFAYIMLILSQKKKSFCKTALREKPYLPCLPTLVLEMPATRAQWAHISIQSKESSLTWIFMMTT